MKIWKESLMIAIICLAVICLYFLATYVVSAMVNNHRLEVAVNSAKNNEVVDGYVFKDIVDWWGKPIQINCGPTDNGKAFVYTAVSSGKDKLIGTADDLTRTKVDLNKSKMLGQYTAKKLKEFVKGFKEGEKEPSKFDGK